MTDTSLLFKWLGAACFCLASPLVQAATPIPGLTPVDMRGRVSAVHSLFTGTSNHLGQFESGVTAAWWGTVPAVVVGGVGTLVVVGALHLLGLIAAHSGRDLILVAHFGAILTQVQRARGCTGAEVLAQGIDNLSVTRIDHAVGGWSLGVVNHVA